MMDVTYCTGLWLVQGNQKRSSEHYFRLIPETCRMLSGKQLVLFCDNHVVEDHFNSGSRTYGIDLVVVRRSIEELPLHSHAGYLIGCCERMNLEERPRSFSGEKGVIHYWRDYKDAGEAAYTQMLSIWISKISIADYVAASNYFGTEGVAWVDASVSRFCGERTNWNFTRIKPDGEQVQHYASSMNFLGKRLPINASFLQTNREGWKRLSRLFTKELEKHLADDYAHDEETILSFCKTSEPSMFRTIGRPCAGWRRRINALLRSRIA